MDSGYARTHLTFDRQCVAIIVNTHFTCGPEDHSGQRRATFLLCKYLPMENRAQDYALHYRSNAKDENSNR